MAACIVIIEDNLANLELVTYLLQFSGYEVRVARDGGQGVAMVRDVHPDLVICDLQMPVFDGYQVLAQLRAWPETLGIPVVAVTAFSMPNDRQKVMTAGFDGYVSKPIEPDSFVERISAFLPPALRRPPVAPGA